MYAKEEIEKAFVKWYTLPHNEYEFTDFGFMSIEEREKEAKYMAEWIVNAIEEERTANIFL